MKKQFIASLVLVLSLTTVAQPSFAMKRSRVGHPVDHLSSAISSIVLLMKYYLGHQPDALTVDDPYYFQPNHITFVSQSGTNFEIHVDNLEALLRLSRTIAALLSDLASTDLSDGLALPGVNDTALYLLTRMASGAEQEDLLNYIRALSNSDIEELKRDAELLDSQALKDLISNAKDNPFTWLPSEVIPLILERVGPKSRSSCASTDKSLNGAVATVRKPVANGGFGCTDTLPIRHCTSKKGRVISLMAHAQMLYVVISCDGFNQIDVLDFNEYEEVATVTVGASTEQPVVYGSMLYVSNSDEGTVTVIDTNTNEITSAIQVGQGPQEPVVHGHMLYVLNTEDETISVIDTHTNLVVATIAVGRRTRQPVAYGKMLYLTYFDDDIVSVIDTSTNLVVATLNVGRNSNKPVVHNQRLYVPSYADGTITVIDMNTNLVVATIGAGDHPLDPVFHGDTLYVANYFAGTILAIDTNTNQGLATHLGGNPTNLLVHGDLLFVPLEKTNISIINLKTLQLIATIELKGYYDQLVVHGQMLHVVDAFNGIVSVIDIGGYLPGQL